MEVKQAEEEPAPKPVEIPAVNRVSESKPAIPRSEPPTVETPSPKPVENFQTVNLDEQENHPPRLVTVLLHSTGDRERDIRRISRLYGMFISCPGKDRFQFHIHEEGKSHLIDFPNDTTHISRALLKQVGDFVGGDNLQVEPVV